ncbi:hypothetical protein GE061_000017, partial [Apolygus lucorum]
MRIPKSSLFVWLALLSPLVCGQDDDEGIGTNSRPWLNNKQQSTAWNQANDNNVIIKEPSYFVVASRMRNGVEMGAASQAMKPGITETLMIRVPPTSVRGDFKLRVEGLYNSLFGGSAFVNETMLTFSQRSMTIFIQTDKPIYIQGETVNIRAIPINTELRPFDNTVDIFILDPKRYIMRRWLSRQSNLGTVSLNYQLSNQPRFGNWTIQVVAQKQVEEFVFLVEEYYQTRFEVNVTMPAFFFTTEQYVTGMVMANYTSGGPVSGNLTLKASIRPIRGERDFRNTDPSYGYSEVVEKYFTFDEAVPFWYPASYYYSNSQTIPHLRFFNGVYEFRYPIAELEKHVPTLDGMEVMVTATVGERFLDEVITAYSIARVFNSSVQVNFLGGSPQVFKPAMPLSTYISVSFHDGSPLSPERLLTGQMEVTAEVISRSAGRRTIEPYPLKMSEYTGIWEMKIDLRSQLGLDEDSKRAFEILNAVDSMRITASYRDSMGTVQASMLLLSHYSPTHNHIKISTSTSDAKVGEYIIFHVQSNFYMESFDYLVMSKGIVLHSSQEIMTNNIRTFAVTLSAEMAPAATVLVYTLARHGDIVADSLTFPVNGISRNNFTVFINNKKARTGKKVEVAIYGEPGAYVGLSGIDKAFYTMQAGNELTYAKVLQKMATFDEQTNGTYAQIWQSHEGDPDELVYFPSSTYGIDANRTFEYAGLVVFSDVEITRRPEFCNRTQGLGECLDGRCFRIEKKCDGHLDCEDGTDEAGCPRYNYTELAHFRKFRFSRTQRHYENVWLWRDINIGPHGRYIFEIDVPARPVHWIISAFGMSPGRGFGMLQRPIDYIAVLPFYINVEMPTVCHQGEQIGVRVTVFNYMTNYLEAVVVLGGSPDYKFVHVEMNGIVRSYNPRTSFDTVTRNLHVVADGLPQYRHQSVLLDLSNRAYVFQYMHVNVTDTPIIPYDEARYYVFGSNKAYVSVVGDVVGPIFPTMPVNATSLMGLPMDCAEQTMFSFAANMYTTLYMRLINQRNRTQEKQAFYHMNIGYQKALSFMNDDGSFSLFRSDWNHSSPSVWLTAYCAKVFQEATFYEWENFIYIDPMIIAKSVQWVLRHQTRYGSFYEITWLPDRKMNSTVDWPSNEFRVGQQSRYDEEIKFRNITLTAHVLIMLEAVQDLTS